MTISDRLDLAILQMQSVRERIKREDVPSVRYGMTREDSVSGIVQDCRSTRMELLRIIKELEGNR